MRVRNVLKGAGLVTASAALVTLITFAGILAFTFYNSSDWNGSAPIRAVSAALTREGYCPKHKPQKAPRRVSAEYHSWYSLPIWTDDLRPAQLLREPFCRECAKRGDRIWATVVDHIKPHRGSWPLFIDPANHQSLCKRCHDRKTALEQRKTGGFF